MLNKLFDELYFTSLSLSDISIWNNGAESELHIRCSIKSTHLFCFCWNTEGVVAKGRRTQAACFATFGYLCNELLQKSLIISSWIAQLPVCQDLEAEMTHLRSQLFNFLCFSESQDWPFV